MSLHRTCREADGGGTPFGRYRLVELLGPGGTGEVWRAYDTVTDRVVAIKVLPAQLSDDENFQQWRREHVNRTPFQRRQRILVRQGRTGSLPGPPSISKEAIWGDDR